MNKRHIINGADTTRDGHTPTFTQQPSLDQGTCREDWSNVARIKSRQYQATLAHSCKASRIQIKDICKHPTRHRKRWKITKLGSVSNRPTGGRHHNNSQNVRQKKEQKRNNRPACEWTKPGICQDADQARLYKAPKEPNLTEKFLNHAQFDLKVAKLTSEVTGMSLYLCRIDRKSQESI